MFAKETYMQRRALLKKNLGSGVLEPVHLWYIKSSNVAELMHTTAGILIIIFLQLISLLE